MANEKDKMTNKAMWEKNLRAKYGDDIDEDTLYGNAMKGYDEEHEYRKRNSEENDRMRSAIQASPEIGNFLAEVYERGPEGNPEMAFRALGDLIQEYATGKIDSDEYLKRKGEETKANTEREAAIKAQDEGFKKWCEKKGYDPEEWMSKVSEVLLTPMTNYKLAEANWEALDKMINYDADVADAQTAGRVAGRNERIAAARKSEMDTDGLARNHGGSVAVGNKERNFMDDMVAARKARMA